MQARAGEQCDAEQLEHCPPPRRPTGSHRPTPGGHRLVRRPGRPVADHDDAAAGDRPGEDHRPGSAVWTDCPGCPARSTPRWPAPYGKSGGSKRSTTSGSGRSGHTPTGSSLAPHRGRRAAHEKRSRGSSAGAVGSPVAWPDPRAPSRPTPARSGRLPGLWTTAPARAACGQFAALGDWPAGAEWRRIVRGPAPGPYAGHAPVRRSRNSHVRRPRRVPSERDRPWMTAPQSRAIGSGRTQTSGPN